MQMIRLFLVQVSVLIYACTAKFIEMEPFTSVFIAYVTWKRVTKFVTVMETASILPWWTISSSYISDKYHQCELKISYLLNIWQ